MPSNLTANTVDANQLIYQALAKGVTQLDTYKVQPILLAHDLSTLLTWITKDSAEAVYIAKKIGYPVALKLHSPYIPHKSEVQGVVLYLLTANEVQYAAEKILNRVKYNLPASTHSRPTSAEHGLSAPSAQELLITVE
ncbi:MAG: hypothetical protein G5663_02240 [Serratia symbiotica]|nr:hypothetical protein [Serratia symbiotica]